MRRGPFAAILACAVVAALPLPASPLVRGRLGAGVLHDGSDGRDGTVGAYADAGFTLSPEKDAGRAGFGLSGGLQYAATGVPEGGSAGKVWIGTEMGPSWRMAFDDVAVTYTLAPEAGYYMDADGGGGRLCAGGVVRCGTHVAAGPRLGVGIDLAFHYLSHRGLATQFGASLVI